MKRRPPDAIKPRRYSYRQSFVKFDRPYPLKLQGKEVPGFLVHGEPVTIAIPLPEVSPLTQQEKQRIIEESGVNFLTADDWHTINEALCRYVLDLRQAREGDYDEIVARLQKIKASALALIESVTVNDEPSELALNRLFKVTGEGLYGKIAGMVSEIARKVDDTLDSIKTERTLPKPAPLWAFVKSVKDIFDSRGVRFTCPKANTDYKNPRPSQAQTFMRAVLSVLPKEFRSGNLGDGSKAAFMAATAEALSRTRSTKSADAR